MNRNAECEAPGSRIGCIIDCTQIPQNGTRSRAPRDNSCPGRDAARSSCEALLRRTGTVPNTGVRYGPGSAAHRSARATRCAASGARKHPAQTKTAGFPPPFPMVSWSLQITGADGARSAATGWPAQGPRPRSTGESTAPGCWPLPRWCRPASGWTSRSAAR
jgi:hypothetical protein